MSYKKSLFFVFFLVIVFALSGCTISFVIGAPTAHTDNGLSEPSPSAGPHLINPGEVFRSGSYIEVSGVRILYNGDSFEVKNNRADCIRITAAIVGIKKDGSREWLQMPAFSGVDTYQYNKDLDENGWAVENYTNMVRPGETLIAYMKIMDFSHTGYPAPDIDGDGYYDIIFTISPQEDENSIQASTTDPESEVYKLPVE